MVVRLRSDIGHARNRLRLGVGANDRAPTTIPNEGLDREWRRGWDTPFPIIFPSYSACYNSTLRAFCTTFLYLTSTPNPEHRAFTIMIQPQLLFAIPEPSHLIHRGMNQPRTMLPRQHERSFEGPGGTFSRTLIAGWVSTHRTAPKRGWGYPETRCSGKVPFPFMPKKEAATTTKGYPFYHAKYIPQWMRRP